MTVLIKHFRGLYTKRYLEGIKNGLKIDTRRISLGELMKIWLFETVRVSGRIKPTTFEKYEGLYKNFNI